MATIQANDQRRKECRHHNTHVMDEAERCDKVGLIVDGRIFAIDTPTNLKQRFNVDTIEAVFIKAEVRQS